MNVDYCPRCDKLYAKNQHKMCLNCIKELEAIYDKCNKYLREHRMTTLQELSDATEVSVSQIAKFIREGKISIANRTNIQLPCEVCGIQIREGHLCHSCRSKLIKDVSNLKEDQLRAAEMKRDSSATFNINKERR
jgi:flagellar operon protein (TIGR03826 family)